MILINLLYLTVFNLMISIIPTYMLDQYNLINDDSRFILVLVIFLLSIVGLFLIELRKDTPKIAQ